MNVKRFFAPTAREALRRVKEELGGEAIVLSNRPAEGGVEILALPPRALAGLVDLPRAAPTRADPSRIEVPRADVEEDYTVTLSAKGQASPAIKAWRPFQATKLAAAPAPERAAPVRTPAIEPPAPAARPAAPAEVPGTNGDALAAQLRGEMAEIRGLIERQLAGFAWGELARESPVKSVLLGELLEAGFSGDLARRLVDEIGSASDMAIARNAVRNTLSRDLITLGSDADIIDRGGVYALVGPTGVGKTTTTAKLAARCVVRHGAEKLALLTTDGYRIGAHEQLKIYGRILGVSVYSVRDTSELRRTLAELRGKHMVLIDTVGMSQRDRAVAEQAAMLLQAGKIERLLLLNATSRGDTLDDVVRAYSGPDLAGCILTKVDESVSLASAIDVVVRHRLGMFYVANGQRVPEDLHLPNRPYLLHRSLKTCPESSAHHLIGGEAGLLLAAGAGAARAGQGAQLG